MEIPQITLEQAFLNIQSVLDQVTAKRQEHAMLEQSINIIKNSCYNKPVDDNIKKAGN